MNVVAAELERAWCAEYPEPWGDPRGALARALAPLAVALVLVLAFAGGALDRLVRFVPSAAPVAGVGHRMLAVVGSALYSAGASAAVLPATAVWLTTEGLTLADSDTTANAWASSRGGVAATLTAPAATNRPAYTAGAVPVLTFDGSDNVLYGAVTKGSAWDTYEWGVVGQRIAWGSTSDMWVAYYNAASHRFSIQDSTTDALFRASIAGGANINGTSDPDGLLAHYAVSCTAAPAIEVMVNGATEASSGAAVTSRPDGGTVSVGGSPVGTLYGSTALRAVYAGPALSTDQRTYLRALLTAATGVSC